MEEGVRIERNVRGGREERKVTGGTARREGGDRRGRGEEREGRGDKRRRRGKGREGGERDGSEMIGHVRAERRRIEFEV